MNVEQRLIDALRSADRIEPSPDLWSRVVHSIEEDKAHRRRVVTSLAITAAMVFALGVAEMVNLIDAPSGLQVRVPAMELIETIALVSLLLTMGFMHAATIVTLPLIALVSNSTRVGRRPPRWVIALLVLTGIGVGLVAFWALVGGIGSVA